MPEISQKLLWNQMEDGSWVSRIAELRTSFIIRDMAPGNDVVADLEQNQRKELGISDHISAKVLEYKGEVYASDRDIVKLMAYADKMYQKMYLPITPLQA